MSNLFNLTVKDQHGNIVARHPSVESDKVYDLARTLRPPLGSTTIMVAGEPEKTQPQAKPTDPFKGLRTRYWNPGTRRPSNEQIECSARRFAADGEYENAARMLALIK